LNRTNRSGIFNGGIIGGRNQTGEWKIDARYNADELVHRIQSIAGLKKHISLTNQDALKFLRAGITRWPGRTLIYLDPPYYVKGRDLYYEFYDHDDHAAVAQFVTQKIICQKWIVSYDNVSAIRDLYAGHSCAAYDIAYSARSSRRGAEVMFFCSDLTPAPLIGAINAADEPSLFGECPAAAS